MAEEYYPRIADKILEIKLKTFGATHIVGPKWCGKTTTANQKAKSSLKLQNVPNKAAIIKTAEITPSVLLEGEKPRLIDEWQDAPEIWDAVRSYCDEHSQKGNFILTGSTSKKVNTSHTGTGRISRLKMYPMSLFESKESNGTVSLIKLFNGEEQLINGCISNLSYDDLIFAACRGGWPESVLLEDKKSKLYISKDYFNQVCEIDLNSVDNVKRNPVTMKAIMRSYARNISTLAKKKSILEDIQSTNKITEPTLDDYITVLEKLFIVEDVYGWCPAIRSSSAIRSGRKREFIDPSIAVAALGTNPESLRLDLHTFGFIFETLCIRDLKIYSSLYNGEISYYHDKYDLEADCVLHLDDGRYALIEFKLGEKNVEDGAKHLLEIERLIKVHNEKEKEYPLRLPDLKIVITGSQYGYKRNDGVFVIPIGCLKE